LEHETYADSSNEARGFEFPCRFTSFAVIDRSRKGRAGPKPGALVAGDDWPG
jgi:hypothetical protein